MRGETEIIESVVAAHAGRNKVEIMARDVLAMASLELGRTLTASELCEALRQIESGSASPEMESVIDAATYLCHRVADRLFGDPIGDAGDEWSEVDITTEWANYGTDTPSDLKVIVRPI